MEARRRWWRRFAAVPGSVVGLALLVLAVTGCRVPVEESDAKSVDVEVLEALPTLDAVGTVALIGAEIDEPTCSFDCPAPARFWFYACNRCRADVEASVTSMGEQLAADGWQPGPSDPASGSMTFTRPETSSRTGEVVLQILWGHGQGLVRDDPTVVVDGTESDIWVRASTEGFGQ